jgi:NADPH:quinone reductase-like Zn-dependent oxidoreductase
MQAMTLKAPGGLDNLVLAERPDPAPKAGEVLVRVRASSLNYHDYVVAAGRMPVRDGIILMSDGAGEVVAVGEGTTEFKVGDKVVSTFTPAWLTGPPVNFSTSIKPGENVDGYAAELVAAPANWFTRMPKDYSYAEAATLTCAGLTAWNGLVRAGLKQGDVVLTQGTGGVSVFALQFAKAAGATVIATSSSDEKLERLRKIGADHVINYRETPQWSRKVLELTGGRGADIVIEVGGAGTLAQSLVACRTGGAISLIGVLTGVGGDFPVYLAFTKQITMHGIAVGSRTDQEDMIRGLEATGMKPIIDSSFPLARLADAYRRQEANKHFGKIIVEY